MNLLHVHIPSARIMEDDLLERVVRRGLNPEIALDAAALERFPPADFQALGDRLHAAGLAVTLHGPFADLAPGATDAGIREISRRRLMQAAALAQALRPRTMVCHADYDQKRHGYRQAQWLRDSTATWKAVAERLAAAGTRLMLENVYEHRPARMMPLLEALDGHGVGVCLDVGHQKVFGRVPLQRWIERLGDHIGQIHLHDNRGRRDDHLPPGQGEIDFSPLLDFLIARRDDPPVVTLEAHTEADLDAALEYARHHLPPPWRRA